MRGDPEFPKHRAERRTEPRPVPCRTAAKRRTAGERRGKGGVAYSRFPGMGWGRSHLPAHPPTQRVSSPGQIMRRSPCRLTFKVAAPGNDQSVRRLVSADDIASATYSHRWCRVSPERAQRAQAATVCSAACRSRRLRIHTSDQHGARNQIHPSRRATSGAPGPTTAPSRKSTPATTHATASRQS